MKPLNYLSHIDSLRALAVLVVIFYHLGVVSFSGGFLGVDVFFVISGFLITRIILNEYKTTGNFSFKKFYAKRARRLLPTLILTLFITFILGIIILPPSSFINVTKSMFMSCIASSNFHFFGQAGYFDIASDYKPLLHTWSLGIEEQFYLIYPATLFYLLKRPNKKHVVYILLVLLIVSFSITLIMSLQDANKNASLHFFLLPFRIFEFLIGGLAVFTPSFLIKNNYKKLLINLLGLSLIIGSFFLINKYTRYLSTLNIIPCLGTVILIITPKSNYLSFLFKNAYLHYIGKISYTLYLIHWPAIVFYKYVFGSKLNLNTTILLLTIIFILSATIYKFYETPLRYKTSKFSIKSNTKLVYIFLFIVLLLFTIKTHVKLTNGWIWRLNEKNIKLVKSIGSVTDFHKNNWGGANYTNYLSRNKSDDSLKLDMIWIGDSHSAHYSYGLDSILHKKHHKNIYVTNFSALLIHEIKPTHLSPERVDKIISQNIKLVKSNPKSTIVISHFWTMQLLRSKFLNKKTGRYEKITDNINGYKVIASKIENYHNLLGPERKLIIMGETPFRDENKTHYIEEILRPKYLSFLPPVPNSFEQPRNCININNYFEDYFSKKSNVYFINPSNAFCESKKCLIQEENVIYFSDNDHLSKYGSLRAIENLEKKLLDIMSY